MSSSRKYLWLAAILVAEAFLLIWKCNHFFNGDSLYFFSHQVGNWADIARVFRGPDHLWQYRPLTFVIFSFLLKPLFGTNPLGYNIFPLFIHAANTLIVFGILRRMGLTERAAFLGTFFFGAHSTAFYVTYCVAFLPDLSYSLFYLLSVYWFVKYRRLAGYGTTALSFLFFLLALTCKEAAITLPLVVFAIAFLGGEQEFQRRQRSVIQTAKVAFVRAFPFLFFGSIYVFFHLLVKSGQVFAPGIDHPHHAEFSLYALQSKYKYLKWAFNLPDGLVFSFEGVANYLIAAAVLIFAVPFALSTIRRLWKLDAIAWCGCIWFIVALSPVLFLRNITMNHNLYVPLVGLALIFGYWMDEVLDHFADRGKTWPRNAIAAFVLAYVAAVFFHNINAAKNSWIAQASMIAETSLQDLKRFRPVLPDGATLYFVDNSSLGSLRWYYDYGSLVRLFYAAKSLDIHFVDRGYKLPDRREMPPGAIVFEYDGSHLSEVPSGI
jgi:protein O-mannosyl-transferase